MKVITSTGNAQLRRLAQLMKKSRLRREEKLFVAEGLRFFREIPPDRLRELYVSEAFLKAHGQELDQALDQAAAAGGSRPACTVLKETLFAHVSDTKTPQGILCLVDRSLPALSDVTGEGGIWILLEDLQDPGNLGTIIRTAEGAGAAGVVLSPGCADVFSPKVVRATMGSIFRVPVLESTCLADEVQALKDRGIPVFAAGLTHAVPYDLADYTGGAAFLIGNEGKGLSDQMMEAADALVSIPMQGQLESLNAAMAAGILMYEAVRQQRSKRHVSHVGTGIS